METQISDMTGKKFLGINTDGSINIVAGLVPYNYDYISLGYTGANISTIIYRSGGATGTIVATLQIQYSGNNIISITRS